MNYKYLPLEVLSVNPTNDRHGELENETAAIAWLFSHNRQHMQKLAADIVSSGGNYEPPLVFPTGNSYTVHDGNRRTTCLKLIDNPKRAPTAELQDFFSKLKENWKGDFPKKILCRVETNIDQIDEILFRRHTGSQGGVGQSTWDGRMKTTFINRTGKGGKLNLADEIEKKLEAAGLLPMNGRIPRSNLNRLLSSEAYRNRVGITTTRGRLEYLRKESVTLKALARIADDLAQRRKTLDDVWDNDRKHAYLDELETAGVLPTAADVFIPNPKPHDTITSQPVLSSTPPLKVSKPKQQTNLISHMDHKINWTADLRRQRAVWNELQFKLSIIDHPNATAVLFRVLLELSVDNYISKSKLSDIKESDSLIRKIIASAEDLNRKNKLQKRYLEVIRKSRTMDEIISVDTLNKYVHSSNLSPSGEHLVALWDTYQELIILFLNTEIIK
ncbi:hypothetical protein HBA94_07620 [Ochrobactrum sp. GRS2]|nr:hypothetical protein [Ochrobactrum sp. GRS2]